MSFRIRRPRQVIGLIYIALYMVIFINFAFLRNDDHSWTLASSFTVTAIMWFILSLAVKIAMFRDRSFELLNLFSIVAFMAIGFTYYPQPDRFSSVESFCYYLNFLGGSAIDLFDFVYEGATSRPKDTIPAAEDRVIQ